jgi:hypothetical protein
MIHEAQPARSQFSLTTDGIAPVGIAAVGDHVARLQRVGDLAEHLLRGGARRHVEQHAARRREPFAEPRGLPDLLEPRLQQLGTGVAAGLPDHRDTRAECVQREPAADTTEPHDADSRTIAHARLSTQHAADVRAA